MRSTASTVMAFWTPDTVRLVQWPVITTVLETPLTLTMLSLQAIVRFSPMPEMLRLPPGGGVGDVDVDGADAVGVGVLLRVVDGTVLRGLVVDGPDVAEMLGAVGDETLESRCTTNAAMPPARAINPMTMTVPKIHHVRLPEGDFGGGPENVPP